MRWYLIQTKPRGESLAQENLERQGYEVYLPRIETPARRHARWRSAPAPLFPRYLFMRLDEGRQALAPAHSTLGVAQVVRFGSDYAIVPECVIHELRDREDPVTGLHRIRLSPELSAGTAVRVTAGPFDGLDGIFQRQAGNERVVVLLTVLGRVAPVQIPLESVVPALTH